MSLRPIFLSALALLLLATACLTTRHIISDLPPVQLRIGSGGGGAGATEYIFLQNGQVFLLESASGKQDTFELETYTWQERRSLFKQLDTLHLMRYNFNFPGDRYFFFRQMDERIDHTVQWGDPSWEVRPDVLAFYEELTTSLKDRRVIFTYGKEDEDEGNEPTFW